MKSKILLMALVVMFMLQGCIVTNYQERYRNYELKKRQELYRKQSEEMERYIDSVYIERMLQRIKRDSLNRDREQKSWRQGV